MARTTISTFQAHASHPEQAIVLIFDLEGFSRFFAQPDVQDYVPKYINLILEAIDLIISGAICYWIEKDKLGAGLPNPIHSKFLGDGAMYIWRYHDFTEAKKVELLNGLWNLHLNFEKVVARAADEIPVIQIPKRIRFGLAAGPVYKLTMGKSRREEYIGYSINLASRLQDYCDSIPIIFSARVNLPKEKIDLHKYVKVVATKLKGLEEEIVLVDKLEYEQLDQNLSKELFKEL